MANKIFKCNLCDKEYKTFGGYARHMENVHDTLESQSPDEILTIEINELFERLKTPKRTGGFRIRRNLMQSEILKLYELYNRKFNTNKKHCNVCTSATAKMYEKLKKIYEDGQE